MKKSILIIAFVVSSFYSCSNSESVDGGQTIDINQLVGTWLIQSATIEGENVSSADKAQFTTNKKVFYTYYNFGANGEDITEIANYTVNGNNLILTSDDANPENETNTFQILELTSTKLKVKSIEDGETLIETYIK